MFKFVLILVVVLGLMGCKDETTSAPSNPANPPNPNTNLQPLDPSVQVFQFDTEGGETDIKMKNGEKFMIKFPESPSTGYQWKLVGKQLPGCLNLVLKRNIAPPNRGSDFVGGSSEIQMLFLARSVCTEKIEYLHSRPWMPPSPEDHRIILHVTVESAQEPLQTY